MEAHVAGITFLADRNHCRCVVAMDGRTRRLCAREISEVIEVLARARMCVSGAEACCIGCELEERALDPGGN